jgi:hypothetical protein
MMEDEAFNAAVEESIKHAEVEKAQRDQAANAFRESFEAARASDAVRQSMKEMGAVDSSKVARALLLQKSLPYTKVKGDALCGMTTVALQTKTTGLLKPNNALQEIKTKLLTLNAKEMTEVFKVSRLMSPTLCNLGGEEAYLSEIATTSDTYLDAGQLLILCATRGVHTVTFYHMHAHLEELTSFKVSLECMLTGDGDVGAIFINSGRGHWDAVCEPPDDTEGAWCIEDGKLRSSTGPRPMAPENPLQRYALSPHPVMLRHRNFKLTGTMLRDLWPSRVEGKVDSLQKFGWLAGDCVHAIADEGVSVSDQKLVHDKDACVDPFDGCHRLKAVGVLEHHDESRPYGFEIPTMLYRHDTPKCLWLPDAFARLEVNQCCNAYSTIDLIRLAGVTLSEYAGKFTEKEKESKEKATVVFEAWYGAPPAGGSVRVTALDIIQISNVLECHMELVASGQLNFVVKDLGARDHLKAAKCCHQLLDSEFIEGDLTGKFKDGACFLALPNRPGRRFLPFGPDHRGLYRATQRGKPTMLKEMFLWVYGSWVLSGGAKHTSTEEWKRASDRIKRRLKLKASSDLDKLYQVHNAAPTKYDLFTLELLAAQPGLLKKAAIKLNWTALLDLDLTGSRNSVVHSSSSSSTSR